jgi:hypothetical protein
MVKKRRCPSCSLKRLGIDEAAEHALSSFACTHREKTNLSKNQIENRRSISTSINAMPYWSSIKRQMIESKYSSQKNCRRLVIICTALSVLKLPTRVMLDSGSTFHVPEGPRLKLLRKPW